LFLKKQSSSTFLSQLALLSGPVLFSLVLFINPFGLDPIARNVLSVAVLMIAWWGTEAIPMPAVSILPLVLFPLMGISNIKDTAAPYANEVIFLIMGGFMIGLAIEKWKLHTRIALSIVQFTGTGGNRIILGFILATGFISMWLSNTATTMMMYPIAISVISVVYAKHDGNPYIRNFALSIMLAIAYASNFGGIATIIGTPPNVAYASFISKKYGVDISFFDWMLVAMPISILLLLSLFVVLIKMFPNKIGANQEMQTMIKSEMRALGPMTVPEKRVLIIFITTALLWITRDLINKNGFFRLDDSMIAVFGALLMFIVPAGIDNGRTDKILDWPDTSKMAWGILLLFGGGITLATGLENAGIIAKVGEWLAGYSGGSVIYLVLLIVVLSIFISEFMSNVAQVIVFAPLVTAIAEAVGANPFMLGVPMALAASCASMMPMGTPPNAIIFSSGYVRLKDMLKAGFVMNLISIVLIMLFSYFVLPYVFALAK
jgi:sodium-dependent dicarboxylate transporter 2/3/5